MNQTALKRLIAARAGLLLDEPFWGVPALRLQPMEDLSCETAWVNGQVIGYNPTFIMECTAAELTFLWVHEVWHCAMGHPWRRGGRDPEEWNEAADRAINPVLRDAQFTLPKGVLVELAPEHVGKSAEWIHARMPKKPKKPGQQQGGQPQPGDGQPGTQPQGKGQGKGQGQGMPDETPTQPGATQGDAGGSGKAGKDYGEVRDAPTAAEGQEPQQTEEDWRQLIQQAAVVARGRGKLPAMMERAVSQASKSRTDWRASMHRFAQETASVDYSWAQPNKRYVAHGLYMPRLQGKEVGCIAVGVDTSGSIDAVLLAQFEEEVRAVVEDVRPRKTVVFYADAAVHRTEEFERDDVVKLKAKGGGGTDFRPVFDAIEKMDESPVCLIYLTDLDGTFPKEETVPTLWVTAESTQRKPPFGELLEANT